MGGRAWHSQNVRGSGGGFRGSGGGCGFHLLSTATHADFIIRAAGAGKHIFCEKPIHTDIGKIQEALRAVEEAGVKLQIVLSAGLTAVTELSATPWLRESSEPP